MVRTKTDTQKLIELAGRLSLSKRGNGKSSRGTQTDYKPRSGLRSGGKLTQKSRTVQTRTKYKKQYKDDPNAGDLAVNKYSGGRKTRQNVKGAWKVLTANQQNNTYAWACVNRYMTPPTATTPPGYCMLGTSWSGASIGTGKVTLPLCLIPLSAAPNVAKGVIGYPTALYVAVRGSAGGPLVFDSFNTWGLTQTAGTATGPQSFPGQSDIFKAIQAKMILYGTLSRPVKWRVDIVQLTEPYLHPENATQNPTNTEKDNCTAFYTELLREYSYSPATFNDQNVTRGKIKYIKSFTHLIQPRNTSEANVQENLTGSAETTLPIAHSHSFNVYHIFNRRQRYNWDDNETTVEPTGNANDNIAVVQGVNRTDVTYRARVYMMIRALAPSPNINGTWEPTITPSFDMSMRAYHTNLG